MKLPENRTERIKVLLLVVVGTGAVIYGVIFGAIRPLLARKAKLEGDIERFNGDLAKAKGMISRIDRAKADNLAIAKEIQDISSRCILHSRHGNYMIGARRIIEQAAAHAGVDIVAVTELGVSVLEIRDASAANQKSEKAFKSYTAEVTARAGLSALVSMLELAETSNPYLCVSKLQITADEKDPQLHRISFRIQWPIWADPEMGESLGEQTGEPVVGESRKPGEGARP